MKKLLSAIFMGLGLLAFTACGNNDPTPVNGAQGQTPTGDPVEVTVVFGKPEVMTEFEQMLSIFNSENTQNITVSIIPTEDGQGVVERVRLQYAAADPVTIMHLDAGFVPEFENYIRDLSDQPWVANAMTGVLNFVTRADGRVMGMPASLEGFGFVYNRAAVQAALGNFDTSTIRTRDQLQAFFQDLEAAGQNAIITTPSLDWSLGFHFMNKFLATQSQDFHENLAFLDTLLRGTANLYSNARYQEWLNMLDLMLEYNSNAHAPMDPQFDDGVMALADGDVAVWFQGDWINSAMQAFNPDGDFGFLPVPMSNDPNDFANRSISIDVPQYWVVDQHLSTPEQQDAALYFLNWMVSSQTGQRFAAQYLELVSAFYGSEYSSVDPLSIALVDYMERGDSLSWIISYFPNGILTITGGYVQQYSLGLIDRVGLTQGIERAFYELDHQLDL
ncbi:MAG: ABC transporter substrate-binding protein [Defluviitaleaceae bacterium]|nr:ABC transporter substrate-binding protein [Defluviitaleaceae bacterium]